MKSKKIAAGLIAVSMMSSVFYFGDGFSGPDSVKAAANDFNTLYSAAESMTREEATEIFRYILTEDESGEEYIAILGCKNKEEVKVNIPSEIEGVPVKQINRAAFENMDKLESASIPGSVTWMGDSVFAGCSSLTDVVMPKGITSLEASTFSDCSSLETLTLPDGIKTLGNNVFRNCTSLKKVNIPKDAVSIGNEAFFRCGSLESVTIPKGVKSIGYSAFLLNTSLTEVIFSNYVEFVGYDAFSATPWLSQQTGPDIYIGKVLYKYLFENYDNHTIEIKNGTKYISDYAFSRYSEGSDVLTDVMVPASVEEIADRAFYMAGTVTIHGYKDTAAEEYAENHDCKFVALEGEPPAEEPEILSGDTDGDGKVSMKDAIILSRYLAGGWNVEVEEKNADVNRDGRITAADVIILRRYLAGGWGIEL